MAGGGGYTDARGIERGIDCNGNRYIKCAASVLEDKDKRIAELEAALRECMEYIYDEGDEPDGVRMAHVLQNTKPDQT
jgi:hypothetical protein